MVKERLIACLLWRDGTIVQSVNFQHTNVIGSATTAVDFFNIWSIDEIILLDVSRAENRREEFYETIRKLSKRCFVPLSVGGWVKTNKEIRTLLQCGADKVIINTRALEEPEFVTEACKRFGSQCIVASIDVKLTEGEYYVFVDRGREAAGHSATSWAKTVEELGAGEIFLTSIDRDGSKDGYDLDLVRSVSGTVSIPVIASGGAGEWEHLVEGIRDGDADAVSVANRFHHTQHSTKHAKDHMIEAGLDVREPYFYEVEVPRRPTYEVV